MTESLVVTAAKRLVEGMTQKEMEFLAGFLAGKLETAGVGFVKVVEPAAEPEPAAKPAWKGKARRWAKKVVSVVEGAKNGYGVIGEFVKKGEVVKAGTVIYGQAVNGAGELYHWSGILMKDGPATAEVEYGQMVTGGAGKCVQNLKTLVPTGKAAGL